MRDAERHYIDTIRDLRAKTASGTPYELIKASGLFRSLFLEATTLVSLANRERRLKFRFRMSVRPELPPIKGLQWHWHDPSPSAVENQDFVHVLTPDQFLKSACCYAKGRRFAVRDIVLFAANTKGGVHFGTPKDGEELIEEMDAFAASFWPGQNLVGRFQTLRSIYEIAINGLSPLTVALTK